MSEKNIGRVVLRVAALHILAMQLAIATPVSTTLGVEAFAVNTFVQPGIRRNTNGSGPIADSVSEFYGPNTANSTASVDAFGLRASATVSNSFGEGVSASARSYASIVNPFVIVPRVGFIGTQAAIELTYSLDGSLDNSASCATCVSQVQASLGIDGMSEQFYLLAVNSLGTINNPGYASGSLDRSGVLRGFLPVNTELFLRGDLQTYALCQSAPACTASALFGNTLSYFGFSSDAVDIVWGLTPNDRAQQVPEPASLSLLAIGLLGLWRRRQARGAR